MTRFLIYLFPVLADIALASATFVCTLRLAEIKWDGWGGTEVAMVFVVWAVAYIIANQILGRFVNSRNAARMLIIAGLLFTLTAGAFVLFPQLWMIYVIVGILAAATAFFFLPFQVFMKAVEPDQHQGVVRSAALYLVSWSIGFTCGPLIAGCIYQWVGWQWCYAFSGLVSILMVIGVFLLKHHAKHHHEEAVSPQRLEADEAGQDNTNVNYHDFPDMAWLGWVGAGVGCMAVYVVATLIPKIGKALDIPESQVGLIIAMLYATQAFMGLLFLRSRTWMYRPGPVVGFAVFGLAGMAGFCVSLLPALDGVHLLTIPLRTICMCASAVCYGVFAGSFYFGLVFHSLVHPERSARYISINETIVGICCITGPLMAGILADSFNYTTPFIVAMVLVGGVMILQFIVLRRVTAKGVGRRA